MKKSRLLIAPLLIAPLIATSCECFNPNPKPAECTVGSNTEGLTISVTKAIKGQDFKAELGIDTTKITSNVTFPEALNKLTSGDKTLNIKAKEYTYTRKENDKKADLIIPAKNVLGDIDIELSFTNNYTLTFSDTDCDLFYDVEGTKPYATTTFKAGDTFEGYIKLKLEDEYHTLPDTVAFTSGDEPYQDASYNSSTGKVTVTMNADVTITASSEYLWYLDNNYIENLSDADIGTTNTVKVNGVKHTVHLIGVDRDDLAYGSGQAHTTWEFANVITDASGKVLTTKWDSENNSNFPDSVLNTFLNGTAESNDGSVLGMLPEDLQGVIKEVQKPIAKGDSYEVTTYDTKLFPLSYREITENGDSPYAKEEGLTYPYYTGETGDTNQNRKKTKVGETVKGHFCWLRSPALDDVEPDTHVGAFYIWSDGDIFSYFVYGEDNKFSAAPAFCI